MDRFNEDLSFLLNSIRFCAEFTTAKLLKPKLAFSAYCIAYITKKIMQKPKCINAYGMFSKL
jgi:hypothetical protein